MSSQHYIATPNMIQTSAVQTTKCVELEHFISTIGSRMVRNIIVLVIDNLQQVRQH